MSKLKSRLTRKLSTLIRFYLEEKAKWKASNSVNNVSDLKEEDVFFLTGFDKSGTTWLRDMLNDCDKIVCRGSGQFFNFHAPETHFLNSQSVVEGLFERIQSSDEFNTPSSKVWLNESLLHQGFKTFFLTAFLAHKNSGIEKVGDKSTVQGLNEINQFFPKSKKVVILRDGRDITVSFAHHFTRRGQGSRFDESGDIKSDHIDRCAKAYFEYYNHLLQFKNDPNVYFLKYENLLSNTEEELAKVVEFLGVTESAESVARSSKKNNFQNVTGGRKLGEEDASSFFRKGITGDYRNYFSAEQHDQFINIAGNALLNWGYSIDF